MGNEIKVDLVPNFSDGLVAMIKSVEDANIIESVLLQLLNWFKTKHKELPLLPYEPFNNESANTLLHVIIDYMRDEMKK